MEGGPVDDTDDMGDIVADFLVESYENLDQLDQDLVALETDPSSRDLLSGIFRTVHTIKGTAGFLGLGHLEHLAHTGESLLAELRDGERAMDRVTADALLLLVDRLRGMLASIERGRGDGIDAADALAAIEAIRSSGAIPPPERGPAPGDTAPAPVAGHRAGAAGEAGEDSPHSIAESSVRVDVGLLDSLMREVGELVLVRNQIDRLSRDDADPEAQRAVQRLNLIAGELQEGVMRTRMQPIEHVWSAMPRLIRDLSRTLDREVGLVMEGGDTELDRGLLEAVKDPLTHLVRNAVDHGIEPPGDRSAAGKPRKGTVTLRAFHAGGQVVVEISDDGRGIDPDAVGRAAVARGLRTEGQVRSMGTSELFGLLFEPGFSTAEKVTNISGRGVGMDVVRSKVEGIGGSVDVESVIGAGTTWRMRIPLTLAIMPALTVECGGEVFAIAQVNLLELVAIRSGEEGPRIEWVGDAPVFRLRGSLLPLVPLADVLGLDPGEGDLVIAVMQVDDERFGLMVDRVLNTEEIVVKALSSRVKQLGLFSGATVLGDGTVALILDLQAVARQALGTDTGDLVRTRSPQTAPPEAAETRLERLLVVGAAGGRRVGVPLEVVTRLERLPADSVERVGSREVLQYRGALVPLVRLDDVLGTGSAGDADDLPVVVVATGRGGSLALAVDQILDVVDHDPSERSEVRDTALVASTVIDGQVTELLDLPALIRSAEPVQAYDLERMGA